MTVLGNGGNQRQTGEQAVHTPSLTVMFLKGRLHKVVVSV